MNPTFQLVVTLAIGILFYLRRRRSEFNWLLHLVIPVLGIAAFIPAWLTAVTQA